LGIPVRARPTPGEIWQTLLANDRRKRKTQMPTQSIIREFWEFLKWRKRYWLLPIIVMLGLLSAIIGFTEGSAIAPFIYTLF